jgi:hypothetical protein
MFEHTSNSFIFLAVATVALIVWLDSRTSSHAGRRVAFAGQGQQPAQRDLAFEGGQAEPAAPLRPHSGSEANTNQPSGFAENPPPAGV